MTPAMHSGTDFLELSPRERLTALLDEDAPCVELVGPFDRAMSPWLAPQGLVAQSDDGVCVVRSYVEGKEVVAMAIQPAFEGGSIGEVGGAKIACALDLAAESCRAGRRVGALLLLETGGVRLGEATLGLAAIAGIQRAIVELRELAPVVVVVAGPVGCFGGMSLAAGLATQIIGTRHGRLGMNGPEVIEQEAGPAELDASDRKDVWGVFGCEARFAAGRIDMLEAASSVALSAAVKRAFAVESTVSTRLAQPELVLAKLRSSSEVSHVFVA
jgi:malonate decarboxylase beta subunit